ncbi:MAG: hypothetical protein RLY13_655, partial [Actinomycetota bacterium]
VYEDDLEIFNWLRQGAPEKVKSVEAQVMDFADDVAYSVHDFEDAIVAKFVDLQALNDPAAEADLLKKISEWTLDIFSLTDLAEGLHRLRTNEYWLAKFDGSAKDLATLKNLTSSLIGRFVSKTIDAIVDSSPADSMVRFGARIEVPLRVQHEIAVLKGIVSAFLMSHESRQPYYDNQRELLTELAEALMAQNGKNLDSYSSTAWNVAKNEAEKRRVIVDQVACLTDLSAKNLHERLTRAHA